MSIAEKVYTLAPNPLKSLGFNAYAAYLRWRSEGPGLAEKIALLERMDRAPRAEVAAYQLARINDLIAWCRVRVPYYRDALALMPGSDGRLAGLGDLDKLPVLDKSAVRRNSRDLRARGIKLYRGHTSGTTGSPLAVAYDREQLEWNRAVEKIVRRRAGLDQDDRVAVAFEMPIVSPRRKSPPYWKVNLVERELWLSTFHLSVHTAAVYFDVLRSFRAAALNTYPTIAFVLAHFARLNNERLKLKAVLSTSEPLFPFQRDLIQEVFGAEVFDYYGLAERVAFAVECSRHDGLHLLEGFGYVEPGPIGVDEEQEGFVATGLTNLGMPLFRYRVSDVTTVLDEPCGCGLTSRRLAPITTRCEDMLVTPDGRYISASLLDYPFRCLRGITRSQVVQEEISRIVVRVEATPEFDASAETQLREAFRDCLGDAVNVTVERWEHLPHEPSGKFRWVISRVKGIHQVGQLGEELGAGRGGGSS